MPTLQFAIGLLEALALSGVGLLRVLVFSDDEMGFSGAVAVAVALFFIVLTSVVLGMGARVLCFVVLLCNLRIPAFASFFMISRERRRVWVDPPAFLHASCTVIDAPTCSVPALAHARTHARADYCLSLIHI